MITEYAGISLADILQQLADEKFPETKTKGRNCQGLACSVLHAIDTILTESKTPVAHHLQNSCIYTLIKEVESYVKSRVEATISQLENKSDSIGQMSNHNLTQIFINDTEFPLLLARIILLTPLEAYQTLSKFFELCFSHSANLKSVLTQKDEKKAHGDEVDIRKIIVRCGYFPGLIQAAIKTNTLTLN